MSNVESNVVQGHKPMGQGTYFILTEKERVTKAAQEIELKVLRNLCIYVNYGYTFYNEIVGCIL